MADGDCFSEENSENLMKTAETNINSNLFLIESEREDSEINI